MAAAPVAGLRRRGRGGGRARRSPRRRRDRLLRFVARLATLRAALRRRPGPGRRSSRPLATCPPRRGLRRRRGKGGCKPYKGFVDARVPSQTQTAPAARAPRQMRRRARLSRAQPRPFIRVMLRLHLGRRESRDTRGGRFWRQIHGLENFVGLDALLITLRREPAIGVTVRVWLQARAVRGSGVRH